MISSGVDPKIEEVFFFLGGGGGGSDVQWNLVGVYVV